MIWHRRHFAGLNFRPSVRETNIHETVWYFHGYSFSVLGSWLLFFFLLNIWVMLHKPLSGIMLTKCCSPNSITKYPLHSPKRLQSKILFIHSLILWRETAQSVAASLSRSRDRSVSVLSLHEATSGQSTVRVVCCRINKSMWVSGSE